MITGALTALITPFRDGTVDERAFQDLVERQIGSGVHGLVPCGTTGEAATLSEAEHIRVVALCVEAARGRVPVVAGIGSPSTERSIALMREAKRIGADAALAVTPYYNRPGQEGCVRHYEALNAAVELPFFVYNVPARTGIDLSPQALGRIARLPNALGVKDATADIARVALHAELCGPDFVQLSGDDGSALGFNAQGGAGVISVTANIAPALCAQLQDACRRGDYSTARAINDQLAPLHRALFVEPSPGPAKLAASMLGWCAPELRLPMVEPSAAARGVIEAALAHAGLI